jgi:hypothetical protein
VTIPYCTGDVHSGTRTTTSKDTFGLYFGKHKHLDQLPTMFCQRLGCAVDLPVGLILHLARCVSTPTDPRKDGHLNFGLIVDELMAKYGLVDGPNTKILLNGGSAGGAGTFLNADYMSTRFPRSMVKAAPNAGYVLKVLATFVLSTFPWARHVCHLAAYPVRRAACRPYSVSCADRYSPHHLVPEYRPQVLLSWGPGFAAERQRDSA